MQKKVPTQASVQRQRGAILTPNGPCGHGLDWMSSWSSCHIGCLKAKVCFSQPGEVGNEAKVNIRKYDLLCIYDHICAYPILLHERLFKGPRHLCHLHHSKRQGFFPTGEAFDTADSLVPMTGKWIDRQPLVNCSKKLWKITMLLMGKSTNWMAIFHS